MGRSFSTLRRLERIEQLLLIFSLITHEGLLRTSSVGWKVRLTTSIGGFIFIIGILLITIGLLVASNLFNVKFITDNLDIVVFFTLIIGIVDVISGLLLAMMR